MTINSRRPRSNVSLCRFLIFVGVYALTWWCGMFCRDAIVSVTIIFYLCGVTNALSDVLFHGTGYWIAALSVCACLAALGYLNIRGRAPLVTVWFFEVAALLPALGLPWIDRALTPGVTFFCACIFEMWIFFLLAVVEEIELLWHDRVAAVSWEYWSVFGLMLVVSIMQSALLTCFTFFPT